MPTLDQLWPPDWEVDESQWCSTCLRLAREAGAYWEGCDQYPSKHPIAFAKIRLTECDCYIRAVARDDTHDEAAKCAATGRADEPQTSWCGRRVALSEWSFIDASHALLAMKQGSRLTLCLACRAAIRKVLDA